MTQKLSAVWRYNLAITPHQTHRMQSGAKPLFLKYHPKDFTTVLWMLVDPEEEETSVDIRMLVTGEITRYKNIGLHLGSVILPDTTVWHYFVRGSE